MLGDREMNENKILIVDDEAAIRVMLKRAFRRVGYSVRSAASGEEALEILEHEYISVMFLDLGLETMSGFDLCERIRKHSPDAVIYAITGYAKLFGQCEIPEAGFDDYFVKPFSVETLYQAASQAFEKIDLLAKIHGPANHVIERILIIDDDDQFRWVLRKILEKEGFEVMEASDGEDGIKRQSEQPADLIITDVIMPKKNGIETMLDIQKTDSKAKFITVSGGGWYGTEIDFDIAQILGAITIEKPFGRGKILEAIKQLQNSIFAV